MKEVQIPKMFDKIPFTDAWVEYKGEVFYASINFERSMLSKRVMIDLHYCITKYLNNCVIKTVQYNEKKFVYPTNKAN
ncbi:hypothetical protein [Empedobacter brevis]|uniref:hypothetical protein n=1 Tax=Empedobacter brevis TaxID=247 RepID=UPI0023F1972D|nr:hypothetical protein [Empedobacter brevis]